MSYQDHFWMGPGTFQIPLELYQDNRKRLLERLRPFNIQGAVVLLQGGEDLPVFNSDIPHYFRQESFFLWTFGIMKQNCFGAIEVETGRTFGFFPRLPESHNIWMGPIEPLGFYKSKYQLDKVFYSDEIEMGLKEFKCPKFLTLEGKNSDSGLDFKELQFPGMDNFTFIKDLVTFKDFLPSKDIIPSKDILHSKDFLPSKDINVSETFLFNEMSSLRSIKTKNEIDLMRFIAKKSSDAHKYVMKMVKPGMYQYQCEAAFLRYTRNQGANLKPKYHNICCSGKTCAILHYSSNDQEIKDGDMCLFDMGMSYFGYTADITCSFPANGKFTDDQKLIYETVLSANRAVLEVARPGISWECMHLLANHVLLKRLKDIGILKGEVKEMEEANLAYVFQPHGLGHFLGLDVHDAGGYLESHPPRPTKKAAACLRTARKLEEGMIITVEPGCYFIDSVLKEAFCDRNLSRFLVKDMIERFKIIGGVRIEDDVLITKGGNINLCDVPRTVEEIEDFMFC